MSKTISILKNEVRIFITDATDVAQTAMDKHKTLPLASLVLSTAISVFGTYGNIKKGLNTSVNLNGNGPLKNILVETNGFGELRALVGNPFVATDADKNDFNNIPLTVGVGDSGTLKIVHTTDKINFGGEVKLANGDITTDLAYYLDQSEQINSAVISSIQLLTPSKLKHAKAVIFQMLPKHTENDIKWVEDFIKQNKLAELSIEEYVKKIDGVSLEELNLTWKCKCSTKKMKSIASTLSKDEIKDLMIEHGFVEVKCNFCNTSHKFKDL